MVPPLFPMVAGKRELQIRARDLRRVPGMSDICAFCGREDDCSVRLDYVYRCMACIVRSSELPPLRLLIQLMTDHPSARCDAILAEWRRRKDGK